MTIHIEYRVVVDIPEPVFSEFRENQQFQRECIDACQGHLESGTDFYSAPFEWAIFNSLPQAETCERKLMEVMRKYEGKLT